ncbi:arylsulfatase [Croceicoccus hydrothermalis]|uniref:arylsulfatase n=1 Tax=Croceicoccus hydrothermalis TaxID=2867964 RepID=UPI001EFC1FE3
MTNHRAWRSGLLVGLAVLLGSAPLTGQDLDRTILPIPTPEYQGTIAPSLDDAVPYWPPLVQAPADAPNVLLVMTDDVGFGAASTFGGPVPTPNLDRLAQRGTIYNNFHTTAMCSPTHAALLTGRNHHAVGTGALTNVAMGFPGYDGIIPPESATIGRILQGNGYATAWIGKDHNVPNEDTHEAGPYAHWPTNKGFDEFYGFIGSETDQFRPTLFHGTSRVMLDDTDADYILDRDLADHAIDWLRQLDADHPERPFFLYYATGSAHAPQQAPADWIARFRGQFDRGWDAVREETYRRQLARGIIPPGTLISPRPDVIPAWESLLPDRQRLYARYMEVFAAQLAYQDDQFGRILDELEASGEIDNTIIVFVQGDNGASAEGGPEGSLNELMVVIGQPDQDFEEQLSNIDRMGGLDTYQVYPAGWAWATNAPFPLFKQIASHLGGTRNGLVISWPQSIVDGAAIRSQFHHIIDIAPTLLDIIGIPQPHVVDGLNQDPFDGISMAYTFANPAARDRRNTQYFELLGNRAIYHDGWMASTNPGRMPWQNRSSVEPAEFSWSLYNLREDFSQTTDVAAQYPDRLRDLQALFDEQARLYDVYPLRSDLDARISARLRRPIPPRSEYRYRGNRVQIAWSEQPRLAGAFTVAVRYAAGDGALNGAFMATGSRLAGWAFAVEDGVPLVIHNASSSRNDQFVIRAGEPLGSDDAEVRFTFVPDDAQLLLLCHLKTGPFLVRVFRRRHPWLDKEFWHESFEVHGRTEGVRHQAG